MAKRKEQSLKQRIATSGHTEKYRPKRIIHIRDKNFLNQPLHFESRTEHLQFTDDPELVTCKRCLAMMKRAEERRLRDERER